METRQSFVKAVLAIKRWIQGLKLIWKMEEKAKVKTVHIIFVNK